MTQPVVEDCPGDSGSGEQFVGTAFVEPECSEEVCLGRRFGWGELSGDPQDTDGCLGGGT